MNVGIEVYTPEIEPEYFMYNAFYSVAEPIKGEFGGFHGSNEVITQGVPFDLGWTEIEDAWHLDQTSVAVDMDVEREATSMVWGTPWDRERRMSYLPRARSRLLYQKWLTYRARQVGSK